MNKHYIRRFLHLTEQNILGNQTAANENFEEINDRVATNKLLNKHMHDRRIQVFRVCLTLIIAGLVTVWWVKPYRAQSVKQIVSYQPTQKISPSMQKISSLIPFYREGAKHQYLQPVSLRKADIALIHAKAPPDNMHIEPMVDKVIVAPKSFG